jgi:hypothetical protein
MTISSRDAKAAATWASIVSVAVLACSAGSPQPAQLGNCVPIGDASCSLPVNNSSGAGPTDGGSSSDVLLTDDSLSGCGSTLVTTQNTTCLPCIEASCCLDNTACSGLSGCVTLAQCTQACTSTDETCISACFNSVTASVQTAYNDLSSCLSGQCTGCPSLPEQGIADL